MVASSRSNTTCSPPLEGYLSRSVVTCVALSVLVPPFVFGGREAIGQSALALLVLLGSGLAVLRHLMFDCDGPKFRRIEVLLPAAVLLLYGLTWVPMSPKV